MRGGPPPGSIREDPAAKELIALADRVGAAARASASGVGEIRTAALSTAFVWRSVETRLRSELARDQRISRFRAEWVAFLGQRDGELATACAWPATEGARPV